MRARPRPGSPAMRCMAPTRACAGTWNAARPAMCWRWPPLTRWSPPRGPGPVRKLAARLPRRAWQRYSAGEGAKGHRYYDWAWAAIDPEHSGHRWLLIRRNRTTKKLAFYRCYSPRHACLAALVKIAGIRWTTEENFQASKGLTGLD